MSRQNRLDHEILRVVNDLHCHVRCIDHKVDAILKGQGDAITPEDRAALQAATEKLKSSATAVNTAVSEDTPPT